MNNVLASLSGALSKLSRKGAWQGSTDDGALAYAAGIVQFKRQEAADDPDHAEMVTALGEAWLGFATILNDQGLNPDYWQQRADDLEDQLELSGFTDAAIQAAEDAIELRILHVAHLDIGCTPQLEVMCDALVTYGWCWFIRLSDVWGSALEATRMTLEEEKQQYQN